MNNQFTYNPAADVMFVLLTGLVILLNYSTFSAPIDSPEKKLVHINLTPAKTNGKGMDNDELTISVKREGTQILVYLNDETTPSLLNASFKKRIKKYSHVIVNLRMEKILTMIVLNRILILLNSQPGIAINFIVEDR